MRYLVLKALLLSMLLSPARAYCAEVQPLTVIVADEVESLALPQLRERANSGDSKAQAELGARYARGDGVEADMEEAISLFKQGAQADEPNALYYLGTAYYMGAGTSKDADQAALLFMKAAAHGHAGAQYSLGVMMTDGQGGLAADPKGAAALIEKSASQGYFPAAFRMGGLHIAGLGVERDPEAAATWYRRILKVAPDHQAAISLRALIDTREVKWQPGDPGEAIPDDVPSPATTEEAALSPELFIPKPGPEIRTTFKTGQGIEFETRARDGYLGLFSTSDKPYECEIRVTFTFLDQSGQRKPGDWVCFRSKHSAGQGIMVCESAHPNYSQTKVENVELSRCLEQPTN